MKDKLKRLRGRKAWLGMLAVALVLAMVATAFPLHVTRDSTHIGETGVLTVGRGQYHITIGTPVSATTADYTCDGTDDDVQFQAAIDALPSSGGGLLVLTGDYDFAPATTVTRAIDDVSIIGVGASVSFTCDATTAIFTAGGNNWLFSNFETDAGGLAMGATTDWMWLNITIGSTYYALDTEDDPAVDTSGTPVDDDYAKFTDADTVEGRSYAEVRTDLGLVPDTDVPAQASFDDHSAEHENAGADEISVAGLSGLLADDQHVLDAEVQAIKLDDFATPDDNTDLDSSLTEHGLLLKLGGGTTNFLRADGTWAAPAGGGDVTGPGSSTDNMIARHSGTGGKTLQDYTSNPPTISDSGDMNIDGDLDVENIVISGDVDGRDVSVDGTKLDGIDAGADVTGSNSPQAHAASHQNAGGDEISVAGLSGLLADDQHVLDAEVQAIKLDDFATPDDNTDLDSSLTEHGLLPKLGGGTTNFFRADGTWAVPAGGGTVDTSGTPVTNDYARFTDADTIEGRSYAEVQADLSLEIGTDVLAEQTIGIADDNLVEMDDADAADDDYAKFTANGLEGRSYAEVRTDLGLVIGTNVQAYDAELTIIAGLSIADGNLMVGNGSTWVVESGATVRTSLGLGTGDSPQFTAVNVGAAADTTLARSSAGHVSVEGDILLGESDVDDSPSDGDTSDPISSNWAYDHDADGSAHQSNVITITFVINGGGSAISTGEWGHLEIPFACTITQATLTADQSGSIVIDVWKDTYANFPPDNADSITASAPPTISAAQKSQDSTLSGWTTSVSAGDILAFNVDSCATIEIITLSIRATKT